MACEGRPVNRTKSFKASISSNKQKVRSDALNELKTLFENPRRATKLSAINDKLYQKIFEALLKTIILEKQSYLKSKKSARQLEISAEITRLVVQVATPFIKSKTVDKLVKNYIQVLARCEENLFQPLCKDILKCLTIIFRHTPHVEHLKIVTWLETIDFCLQGINQYINANSAESSASNSNYLVQNLSHQKRIKTLNTLCSTSNGGPNSDLTRQNVEDLFQIVILLLSAPNAPVSERYAPIAECAIQFLRLQGSSISQVNQLVFSALNRILHYTRTNHISFTKIAAQKLVPIIGQFLVRKSAAKDEMLNSVRDEMVILIFLVYSHIECTIKEEKGDDFSTQLRELLEIMRIDYSKRSERDQLQLQDLEMNDHSSFYTGSFGLYNFQLREHDIQAERNWSLLLAIAILERINSLSLKIETEKHSEKQQHPRKRQRVCPILHYPINAIAVNNEKEQSAGLQILIFVLEIIQLSCYELEVLLAELHLCSGSERDNVQAWALLAIASCTSQITAKEVCTKKWVQLWRVGMRFLTYSYTCRSASVALHSLLAQKLVLYQDVADDIDSIIRAVEHNGPVTLCDSSIYLMVHLLRIRETEVPGTGLASSEYILRWFFARWKPAERYFAAHYAIHVQPKHVSLLIRACLGLNHVPHDYIDRPTGPIAQAWQIHLEEKPILDYLLLVEEKWPEARTTTNKLCSSCPELTDMYNVNSISTIAKFQTLQKLLLDLLNSVSISTIQGWSSYLVDHRPPISIEIYRSTLYGCIAMLSTLSLCRINNSEKSGTLASSILNLSRELISSADHPERFDSEESKKLTEILLQEIQPYMPPCRSLSISSMKDNATELFQFFVAVAEKFIRTPASGCVTGSNDINMVDVDEELIHLRDIQPTKDYQNLSVMPRTCLALHASPDYIKMCTIGKLCLLTTINVTSHSTRVIPRTFFDDIISLTDEEFLFSQKLLIDILGSDFEINIADANRLVERVGLILSSNNLDRCEVSLTLCANMLSAMEPMWYRSQGSDLSKSATQIYEWIITTVIEKELASSEGQKRISKLLMNVLCSKTPDFETRDEPSSTRSPLFSILQRSEIRVKFFIADQIPKILGNFVLKDHDSVFAEILDCLPSDSDWIEGISFRMSVLTKIGSAWPTLLRRCIYHIFEIPSQIPGSTEYATRCLNNISLKLELNSSKELFKLFSSQILYTWLEHESINDIPFQIFGFGSLQELVKLVSEEATALMIMRGQDNSIQLLANILQSDKICLLRDSFTHAIAYGVAFDLSAPNAFPENCVGAESLMKACFGEKEYLSRVDYHFTDILAVIFDCLDQESAFEKYFQVGDLGYAASIMKRIKKFSTSNIVLPPNNQPVFKVKYLAAEIKFLCSRTKYKLETVFTPAIVTYISRFLLDKIHPALGSLNICSILRKIRVLISISGSVVTTGYPLEMLLQSLGPFVQIPECADDVIGMIQYLLDVGSSYLLGVPSFVAGFSISLFGSLRQQRPTQKGESPGFLSQGSTCNSKKLHSWMRGYFQTYDSPFLSDSQKKGTFQSLIDAAINIQLSGSEKMGTAESNLLFGLLVDENSSQGLLSRPSRDTALAMISSDFQRQVSNGADIINDDEGSIIYSPAIWKSCQNSTNRYYRAWVAKVLGRAFASSGCIHKDMLRESKLAQIKYFTVLSGGEGSSVEATLSFLNELILRNDPQAASVAEKALRYVIAAADERLLMTCKKTIPETLLTALTWFPYQPPPSETRDYSKLHLDISEFLTLESIFKKDWLSNFSIALTRLFPKEPVLAAMELVLSRIPWSAEQTFPFILHLVLTSYSSNSKLIRADLSSAINKWFQSDTPGQEHLRILINSILYLRTQGLAGDFSSVGRARWLEIDLYKSATAACSCGMFKTALLLVEEFYSQLSNSTPHTIGITKTLDPARESAKLLLQIYENIDDPDLYYGVKQSANLDTILARLEHEKDGLKSLAFKGALFDNNIRKNNTASSNDLQSLIEVFDVLNLSGVSNSLLQAFQSSGLPHSSIESLFRTSRKLGKWDIPVPSSYSSNIVSIYKVYQTINISPDLYSVKQAIDEGLEFAINKLIKKKPSTVELHETLQTMAALTEIDEVFESHDSEKFEKLLNRFQKRCSWMRVGRLDDVSPILSCRGTTLGILGEKFELQKMMKIGLADCRLMEVQTALLSSSIYRSHGALQEVLSLATSMIDLIQPCQLVGINPEVAIHIEAAKTLWSQGELSSSIGMLQTLDQTGILDKQTIYIGRSDLLARIGHQISIARLEKSDTIINKYLGPALKELRGQCKGREAGKVFHKFATFCDEQLQNPDSVEDLERVRQMSKNKAEEVKDYEKLIAKAPSLENKIECQSRQAKAKAWLKIDERDLLRQTSNREEFLKHSLENYLLSLVASDDHNRDALRFLALWLEHSAEDRANRAVSKHLKKVPTMKFATLMNQLTSRLQDTDNPFQELLFELVFQICADHPYHGMYQVFTGSFSDTNERDDAAVSRKKAALKLATQLSNLKETRKIWMAIKSTSKAYCVLASEKNSRYKSGKKLGLDISPAAKSLNSTLKAYPIPSPTMRIPFSASLDYSRIPVILEMRSEFSIASGISAPKIITTVAENGMKFRQLVKGGNDDLRQDAIMEQVFEQVNELLMANRSTQQRNLGIRTYRVLPLSNIAGVIEYVSNTVSLHEFLMPAHERFHPEDIKAERCRSQITAVQSKSPEVRIKAFKAIKERFKPVMRYFFTERFYDPDDWFSKRQAYTRSTAAISILGHVLGLGDRHANNILLDENSGEIVHIDLGIAFEMGRILPIPETVPFRLTRDIIDGMGITKTEGVFRRCCEFTLETLQKESYTIMSILDVLRYDPLYSWSVSPFRLAKLLEEQDLSNVNGAGKVSEKRLINEPGEAARALTGIRKKLTKSLSVYATVNDLINQASDERNLALLFAGWAAYA